MKLRPSWNKFNNAHKQCLLRDAINMGVQSTLEPRRKKQRPVISIKLQIVYIKTAVFWHPITIRQMLITYLNVYGKL